MGQNENSSNLRGKFISLSAYIKNWKVLILVSKTLEITDKRSRRQEIIKLRRTEINKIGTNKIQRINETKGWFSEKTN